MISRDLTAYWTAAGLALGFAAKSARTASLLFEPRRFAAWAKRVCIRSNAASFPVHFGFAYFTDSARLVEIAIPFAFIVATICMGLADGCGARRERMNWVRFGSSCVGTRSSSRNGSFRLRLLNGRECSEQIRCWE